MHDLALRPLYATCTNFKEAVCVLTAVRYNRDNRLCGTMGDIKIWR
jgi:hypothetical protein